MAVDYNILARVPSIGSRIISGMEAGRESAIRNQLLARQNQQFEQAQQDRARALQREQQQDAAYEQIAGVLRQAGQDPDNPAVLQQLTAEAFKSRNPQVISAVSLMNERAAKRRQTAEERKRAQEIWARFAPGAAPSAAVPAAAAPLTQPADQLPITATSYDEGRGGRPEVPYGAQAMPVTPAPQVAAPRELPAPRVMVGAPPAANALAPAAAPANALTAQPPRSAELTQLEAERERLEAAQSAFLADGSDFNAKQAAALNAPINRITRQIERLQPKAGPASIQELEAYMLMPPEKRAEFERLQKLKGTSVTVGPQEKAFESELGKVQAAKILKNKAVAEDAVSIIDTVRRGKELLKGPLITGFGAEALTQIGSALNQIGFSVAQDAVANTQAYAANMAQNVGRIIKQFGAGTGLSNADREYAEKMAGGKVTLDRAAIEKILDINERAARNVIARHNKNVSGIKTNIPLTVELPAAQPVYARNPSTGERIMSVDGGNTWTPVR